MKLKSQDKNAIKTQIAIIICTVPCNITFATNMAKDLITKKLAACITVFPNTYSIYQWNENIEQQEEIQLLIKTHIKLQNNLIQYIKCIHPYHTPELLVLTTDNVDLNYASWLNDALKIF